MTFEKTIQKKYLYLTINGFHFYFYDFLAVDLRTLNREKFTETKKHHFIHISKTGGSAMAKIFGKHPDHLADVPQSYYLDTSVYLFAAVICHVHDPKLMNEKMKKMLEIFRPSGGRLAAKKCVQTDRLKVRPGRFGVHPRTVFGRL